MLILDNSPPQEAVAAIGKIDAVPTILEVVCKLTGMGFAAVARVTDTRWVACAVRDEIAFGLRPGGELKIETTLCKEIRDSGNPIVIDHIAKDPVFKNRNTPALYGCQSYLSVPIIRTSGEFFGTLCAMSPRPARLKRPEIVGMFEMFSRLIAFQLENLEKDPTGTALKTERQAQDLREQFIAVLGHDLRNPLAALDGGVRLLDKEPLSDKGKTIVSLMQGSVVRMTGLVDSVMDFARGRLGGGLSLDLVETPLDAMLDQVVNELRTAWPARKIETQFVLGRSVTCDPRRIGQLVSNLVGNALAHGAPDGPVRIKAMTDDQGFELAVANKGKPIPPDTIDRLFQPFFRRAEQGNKGLGLGLYIVSQITKAHGGSVNVVSDKDETRFTVRIASLQVKALAAALMHQRIH